MTSPQTIAVGYDGSPAAQEALRWTFQLADSTGARVVVVYAVGLMARYEGHGASLELEQSVGQLAEDVDFDMTHVRWHLSDGDACSVMLRAIDDPVNADLLVVGSRGQGAHAGLLLGSTSLQLAERSSVPLVIVPSERHFDTT
ncbi:MAG: universal stress protein [Acidimicrobiaceae bacterium]|nr:universal stress protein [Acidimicrobiaceae bacterium]